VTQITDTKYELGLPDIERERRTVQALAEQVPAQTSDAVKLSSCLGEFFCGGGECGGFVVVLAGGQAVVQAAEQAAE
jgi:hypothetical protein